MRSISADFVLTPERLQANQLLVLDDQGTVTSIETYAKGPDGRPLTVSANHGHIRGILTTGFVNAHCHLELSHLKGAIPKHTGMAGFVRQLQGIRNDFTQEERETAIEEAIGELAQSGTVAIGDICNGDSTLERKRVHPEMHFHNFCEVFSLDPLRAENALSKGLDLAAAFGSHSNVTLHAPYSMSPRLRDLVSRHTRSRRVPLSIHFLESKEEREIFEFLDGPLMQLFHGWGLRWSPHTYDSAVEYVLEALPKKINTLLVHCTELRQEEMERIVAGWPLAHFVLCPLANEYIHGTQPPAEMFLQASDRVCLGTDSLAGNDQLSILAEMQFLQREQGIETETLLQWGSANGARALGLPEREFRIEVGATPRLIGMMGIQGDQARITEDVKILLMD